MAKWLIKSNLGVLRSYRMLMIRKRRGVVVETRILQTNDFFFFWALVTVRLVLYDKILFENPQTFTTFHSNFFLFN